VVRVATPGDLALIEEIENSADGLLIELFGAGEWGRAATAVERMVWPGYILVSSETENGPAVGFAHVIELEGFAHLEQLSVLPDYGRRGHGTALIAAAKGEATDRGLQRMTLRTFADVPWNGPFYEKCGFVESEPRTDFHRRLLQTEIVLGLQRYGRRIEMTCVLPTKHEGDSLD
jgi:GNAT superfamily N-acetyltransferase